jgi:hypothetical protein
MGLGVNLEGNPLTDRDYSIVIYLQFVDRNICQVKNPSLTVGQCLRIQQWEDTMDGRCEKHTEIPAEGTFED